jgi:hypothetical protein
MSARDGVSRARKRSAAQAARFKGRHHDRDQLRHGGRLGQACLGVQRVFVAVQRLPERAIVELD